MTIHAFQKLIRGYYRTHKRDLPWRHTRDPYRIMVSEVMLQQTQAGRCIPKYREFLKRFPSAARLAAAPAAGVLRAWQGLGYNRRALMLKRAAEIIVKDWRGRFSRDPKKWDGLPGIGPDTAAAICTYSFNLPLVFIETNIRKIFIYHFFQNSPSVTDRQLVPFIEKTLDRNDPRQWYWALMDYGAWLSRSVPNPGRRSRHYARQSEFKGSFRQLRGQIIKLALAKRTVRLAEIVIHTGRSKDEVRKAVAGLVKEGFLRVSVASIKLA